MLIFMEIGSHSHPVALSIFYASGLLKIYANRKKNDKNGVN